MPEEPPSEPSPFIMPNLYCPVDPDTPYNFEIEPREEEFHLAPIEPLPLRKPHDPDEPGYPSDRMPKSSTEEFFSEKLPEPVRVPRSVEPCHDDEPMMEYPRREPPMMLPMQTPSKFEPAGVVESVEPDFNDSEQLRSEEDPIGALGPSVEDA